MKISVIVPTLNEERRIVGFLKALAEQPIFEVIVVDGNSQDQTFELARGQTTRFQDRLHVIRSARGRANQMNAGAELATGDVLWFLHADVRLPAAAVAWVERVLAAPNCIAGAFKTRTVIDEYTEPKRWWQRHARWWLRLADLRSRYTRLPYGDQAIFVERAAFVLAGGYPDLPLMEDLALARQLAKLGSIGLADDNVLVSGRRFLKNPLLDTTLINIFPMLYRAGVSPSILAAFYRNVR